MYKYFVISDIHGFYQPMLRALRKAGFRKSNPKHILIVCGDIFDRGPDNVRVYKYLRSIPKNRRILIRGNHEYLLRYAVERGYFKDHDWYNGTVETILEFVRYYYPGVLDSGSNALRCFRNTGVLSWIFGTEWRHYYELDEYVFAHSWVPVQNPTGSHIITLSPESGYRSLMFDPDWRNASESEWEECTWGCPWALYLAGCVPPGKTMVCGHWSARDFRLHIDHTPKADSSFDLYTNRGLVALDACTARTGFCNVFVFEKDHGPEFGLSK